jgi:iron complex outermembrane receptor protein
MVFLHLQFRWSIFETSCIKLTFNMSNKSTIILLLLAISDGQTATAEEKSLTPSDEPPTVLEKVIVTGVNTGPQTSVKHDIGQEEISSKQAQVSDTAKLLEDTSGVSFQSNGGVTALPIIHGLNDERIKIEVNGMLIPSACPNHMNPSLSYIDPSNVGKISVLKGVTPVSMGGDSIGGTITVQSAAPVFAEPGKDILINGKASAFIRSNGDNYGGSIALGIANQNARLDYTGSTSESHDYRDGNGDIVRSSAYTNQNHAAALAFNFDHHLLEFKGGQEHVPFQGYPNARMEMTANDSIFGNVHYLGSFDWGSLDSKLYLQNASHTMDAGPDQQGAGPNPNMPMETRAINFGYKVQAELLLGKKDKVRFGNEFHSNILNDYWPGVCTECFDMGPNSFINLNNATRDRLGTFAEWESTWSAKWKSQVGFRYDRTMTDTGNVHGYNDFPFYSRDANAFNAQNHQRNFNTFDLTALMQFTPNEWSQYEFGYARKNRAPSLYELYTWSHWGMAMTMIGWFGDGNAYVGNLNLKPETAHNASFTAEYYDPEDNAWSIKATPYISYVENFIDADRCPSPPCASQPSNGFYYLQIANHDALLWGVDVSSNAELYQNETFGQFATHSIMSYVRGERMDGGNLYHMMPLNLKLSLDHKLEGWKNAFEMQFVDSKQYVQAIRNELKTQSYIVLNAKTGYQWEKVSLDFGVDNLLDKQYYYPLGGSYIGDYYTMSINSTRYPNNRPVPSMGRSFYVGLTLTY